MAYLGNSPVLSQQEYRNIDDISGSFNGVTTSFALLVNGVAPIPGPQTSNQCLISVNGVIQKPDDTGASGFRISGGNIVFSSAPTGGQTFFGVILAGADYIYAGENFPDGTVSAPTITFAQDLDTGFYRSGAGEVKFTANGVNTVTFSSNGLTAPNFIPSGSSVPTNGVYLPSANNVAIATNSTQRLLIDSSGQIEAVSLGSAAAPTWSFTTDPNTGIYSPGADQVAISTGGSGRLFVDASGNVGAGTSSPAFAAGGGIQAKYATFSSFRATVGANTGTDFSAASDGKGYVYVRDNADLLIGTNNTERLRITAAGLVGVGTNSPNSLLHVEGGQTYMNRNGAGAQQVLQLNNSDTTAGTQVVKLAFGSSGSTKASINAAVFGNDFLTFNTGSDTERMRIDSSGRVGIGNSSPGSYNASSDDLVVGDHVGAHGVTICSQNNSSGYIMFADGTTGAQTYAGQITYDHTNNRLTLGTNDGTTSLTIDSSQRVGIGTTSPASALEVAGTANEIVRFRGNGASGSYVTWNSGGTNYGYIGPASQLASGTSTQFTIRSENELIFTSNGGSERARIDTSGRLLVGTSSVYLDYNGSGSGWSGSLIVARNAYDATAQFQNWNSNANLNSEGGTSIFISRSKSGTIGTHTALASGDDIGSLIFNASDGSNFRTAASIKAVCDAGVSTADVPGRLVFSTTADGASSPTERMRITQKGFTKITKTGAIHSADATYHEIGNKNDVSGDVNLVLLLGGSNTANTASRFFVCGDNVDDRLVIYGNGNVVNKNNSYGALSDVKLKENIVDASSQWSDIKDLRVRKYNLKDDTGQQTHTQIGLIAQEVELVSPGLVSESPDCDKDGNDLGTVTKSVNYSVLYMKAVKALQEAMERIEQLEAEMAEVKAQLS